jgi:hypothetical protein
VARRGGCCGDGGVCLAVQVRPHGRNVSVGDGVLDVPPLVCRRNLRQMTCPSGVGAVGCRCPWTRFARPGRAGAVVVAGISGRLFCRGRCPQRPVRSLYGCGGFTALLPWSLCSLRLLFGCGGSRTVALWSRGRDAEGSIPYMGLPHPAASGDAPTASTTCGSNRSSTILPETTPTAVRAYIQSNLSL